MTAQAVLLAQLIDNLLENALQYSEPGTPIVITATRESGHVVVVVKDLGPAVLLFGAFLALLYLATQRAIYPAVGALLLLLAAFVGYKLHVGFFATRVTMWLNPWGNSERLGAQLAQAWPAEQCLQRISTRGRADERRFEMLADGPLGRRSGRRSKRRSTTNCPTFPARRSSTARG